MQYQQGPGTKETNVLFDYQHWFGPTVELSRLSDILDFCTSKNEVVSINHA